MTDDPIACNTLNDRQFEVEIQSGSIFPVKTICSRCGWACKVESCARCKFHNTTSELPHVMKMLAPALTLSIDILPSVSPVVGSPVLTITQGIALDILSAHATPPLQELAGAACKRCSMVKIAPTSTSKSGEEPNFALPTAQTLETVTNPDESFKKETAPDLTKVDSNKLNPNNESSLKPMHRVKRNWSDIKHPDRDAVEHLYSDSSQSDEKTGIERFLSSDGSIEQAERLCKTPLVEPPTLKLEAEEQSCCKTEGTDTEEEF